MLSPHCRAALNILWCCREDSLRRIFGRRARPVGLAPSRGIIGEEHMALKVIGAGLGRTGTLSLKLALDHLGFGPCYHMIEIMSGASVRMPQWLQVVRGAPDWDVIFEGYSSTVDYPTCTYWRELAAHYPEAK